MLGSVAVVSLRRLGLGRSLRLSFATVPLSIAGLLVGGWLGARSELGRVALEYLNPQLLESELPTALGAAMGGLLGLAAGAATWATAGQLWSGRSER